MTTSTFPRGTRVVVESPVYCGEADTDFSVAVYTHPGNDLVGATGTIVRGPDSQGDYYVNLAGKDLPGDGTYVHYSGLLKVDDLPRIVSERRTEAALEAAAAAGIAVGDTVEIASLDVAACGRKVGDLVEVKRIRDQYGIPAVVIPCATFSSSGLTDTIPLAAVRKPAPTFAEGDRVRVKEGAMWLSASGARYTVPVSRFGKEATVIPARGGDHAGNTRLRIDGLHGPASRGYMVRTSDLEPVVEEAPTFAEGDRVRTKGRPSWRYRGEVSRYYTDTHTDAEGTVTGAGIEGNVKVRFDKDLAGYPGRNVLPAYLEKIEEAPAPAVSVGDRVKVSTRAYIGATACNGTGTVTRTGLRGHRGPIEVRLTDGAALTYLPEEITLLEAEEPLAEWERALLSGEAATAAPAAPTPVSARHAVGDTLVIVADTEDDHGLEVGTVVEVLRADATDDDLPWCVDTYPAAKGAWGVWVAPGDVVKVTLPASKGRTVALAIEANVAPFVEAIREAADEIAKVTATPADA